MMGSCQGTLRDCKSCHETCMLKSVQIPRYDFLKFIFKMHRLKVVIKIEVDRKF